MRCSFSLLIQLATVLIICSAQSPYRPRWDVRRTPLWPDRFGWNNFEQAPRQPYGRSLIPDSLNLVRRGAKEPDEVQPTPPANSTSFADFFPPKWKKHVVDLISQAVTKFSIHMDRAIEQTQAKSDSPENIIFSPISLTGTLAMVLLASAGKTFDEVARVLNLESGVDVTQHSEIVHQIFGLMLHEAENDEAAATGLPDYNYAFGIFVENGFPIREQFKQVSEQLYKSEVINLNFSSNGPESQKTINDWVSDRTHGKIQNMLSHPPDAKTEVLIASALYFQGEWLQHFIEEATSKSTFAIEPAGNSFAIDMMFNAGDFPFYEDAKLGAKIVGLPYKGKEVTMYVILPNVPGANALKEFRSQLTVEMLEYLISNTKNQTCMVGLPKMKLSSNLMLQSALEALGLHSLFDPATADLSILSPGKNYNTQPAVTVKPYDPSQIYQLQIQQEPLKETCFNPPPRTDQRFGRSVRMREFDRDHIFAIDPRNKRFGFKVAPRYARESRPIDQEFLDFINSQNLTNFGIDKLRNTAGITNPGLFADDVIHRVEMTVDERGTEAAASTSTLIDRMGGAKRLVADRPFLFFIRHEASKLIWFWGTVNKPDPLIK